MKLAGMVWRKRCFHQNRLPYSINAYLLCKDDNLTVGGGGLIGHWRRSHLLLVGSDLVA